MTPLLWFLVSVAVLVLLVAALATAFNRLVLLRSEVADARSQIDVQLTRRHELVPALVAAVRGYLDHERGVLVEVARARAAAVAAASASLPARAEPENALSSALGSLQVVVESSPQLRSAANVLRLQEDLVSTENRIALARQHHNDAVMAYENGRSTLPLVLLAGRLGFGPAGYLDLRLSSGPPERQAVER